jgi:methyltransferase-like protein 6
MAHKHVSYHSDDFPFEDLAAAAEAYSARVSLLPPPPPAREALVVAESEARWSLFHAAHGGGFFKPRYYVLSAFPVLADARRILEVGCGSGSNVFPLLERTGAHVTASDFSPAALRALAAHPAHAGAVAASRLCALAWDAARAPLPPDTPSDFDATLLTFTASAIHPRDHGALFAHAASTLRVGGVLAFRDYGERDAAQLRAKDRAGLSPATHVRLDGTLAHYFGLDEVRARLEGAGLAVEALDFARVRNVNRATGVEMRRCFVTALARRLR